MKNIVILTGNELRHKYFKIMLANDKNIKVLRSYCEYEKKIPIKAGTVSKIQTTHLLERENAEKDFFSDIVLTLKDKSSSTLILKGMINDKKCVQQIKKLNPDLIITYGCSIIKPNLIDIFPGKIINVHLGLSPYYFGSGTNFHPLVENKPQLVGYTFMYIDYGIDTGEIIHQRRATIHFFDNPHQIGTRLIKDMTFDMIKLINNFEKIKKINKKIKTIGKTYKMRDVTDNHYQKLYENFENDICSKYLTKKKMIDKKYPILEQNILRQ